MSNRSVEDIVLRSFRMIGEFRRGEVLADGQINEAFDIMNDMLSAFSMSALYIPYETKISFLLTPPVDQYIFTSVPQPIGPPPTPGAPIVIGVNQIIKLNHVNITVGSSPGALDWPLRIISKAEFYEVARIKSSSSVPGYCFLNIQNQESTVQFYPSPNIVYPVEIKAKVALDSLTRFTDITSLPPFYFKFLIFSLARELISYYPSANWTPEAEKEFVEMRKLIQGTPDFDLSIRPDRTLGLGRRNCAYSSVGLFIV